MKNLQLALFNNDGSLVAIHKIDHCDCVKSHSIFYLRNSNDKKQFNLGSVIRITETIYNINLIDGKVIIRYRLGYAEITKY